MEIKMRTLIPSFAVSRSAGPRDGYVGEKEFVRDASV
jgi:hypothetical protein